MTIAADSKCVLCQARATREFKGKPYCVLHYTILVKNPPAPVSMVIPDWYSKADPNY